MIKTLRNLLKQDKERFVVPRGVQDVIPIKAIFDDGIFQVGRDKFSKTYKFSDINYAVASREDKEAKVTAAGVKSAAKATTGAVKTAFTAAKALVAAIMAGGWGAVAVIVMICMIGLICGSVFGVFFSGEDSGTGMSMQTAVQEINAEYDAKVEDEKSAASYDNVEISGGRAVWKEVLAVYAVKTNTDKDNPQEVVTMDESKKQTLSDIFWEMNSISSHCKSHSETEVTETDDGNGNIVQQKTTVTKRTLYITVSHMTANEMADRYGFDEEQRRYIAELLKDENNSVWAAVLYGIKYSDNQIVSVALSQVGKLKRLTERSSALLGVSISNNIDKKTGKLLPAFLFACVIEYSCCGFVCCCI